MSIEICPTCKQHLKCQEKCPYCAHGAPCEVTRAHDGTSQWQLHGHANCSGNSELPSQWATGTPQRYFPPTITHIGNATVGGFIPTVGQASTNHVSPPNPTQVVQGGEPPEGFFQPEVLENVKKEGA